VKASVFVSALALLPFVVAAHASVAGAQVVSSLAGVHAMTTSSITATADVVDEELFSFRPSDDVRTLGQILAHIADSNYQICAAAAGQDNPNTVSLEETATTKAAIREALAAAFAFCGGIYETMSDETGAETIPFFGGQQMARVATRRNCF